MEIKGVFCWSWGKWKILYFFPYPLQGVEPSDVIASWNAFNPSLQC